MTFASPLALSVSLALATVSAPAFAEAAAKQVAVAYGDLDLAQPAGAEALYARIRTAARTVCAPAAGRTAAQRVAFNACRREAVDRAVATLGSDSLVRLHAAKTTRNAARRSS